MTVKILNNDYVKLYSLGIEKDYTGSEIIYNDDSMTFLFFYYECFVRLYVVNGKKKIINLVQVKEKCNIIINFDDKEARRIRTFIGTKVENKIIFYLPEEFFQKIKLIINDRNWKYKIENIYKEYLGDYLDGINNFNS